MAWTPSGRDAAVVALAVVAAGATACTSTQFTCPCPSGGGGSSTSVAVPSAQTTTIDSILTETPCVATEDGTGTGIVLVVRPDPGVCQVRVALRSGGVYTFSVEFRVSGSGCCGDIYAVDASVPELVDAEAGGTN